MAAPVGISLILKENLVDRLTKTLPLLERMEKTFGTLNKTLNNLETSQKRVDSNFKNIGRSVDMVSNKERGLRNLSTGITGIGSAATSASGMLSGLVAKLGLVVGAYKLMQGAAAMGGEAIDFQASTEALRRKGFTNKQVSGIQDESLRLGSSGKSVLSARDYMETAGGVYALMPSSKVKGSLAEFGRFAKQAKISGIEFDHPEALARMWEIFGMGNATDAQKQKFDTQLMKGMQGSNITLGQILQQSSTANSWMIGDDPMASMMQLLFATKESAGGMGGGGASRGRAGQGYGAMAQLRTGKFPVALAKMLEKHGHMPGLSKYYEAGKGSAHSTLAGSDPLAMHRMGGKGGSSTLKPSGEMAYAMSSDAAPWLQAAASNPNIFDDMMLRLAAEEAGFKGTPTQLDAQFHKLSPGRQKQLLGALPLGNKLASMQLIARHAGRGQTSWDTFNTQVGNAKGFDDQGITPIKTKWEMLTAAMTSFGDALGKSPELINSVNHALDGLSKMIQGLNDNIAPIAKVLSILISNTVAQSTGQPHDGIIPDLLKMNEQGGFVATGGWKKTLASGVHDKDIQYFIDAGKRLHAPPAVVDAAIAGAMAESSLNPIMRNSIGARGYRQFMPFGKPGTAGTNVPDCLAYSPDYAASSFISNLQNAVSHKHYNSWGAAVEDIQHSGLNSGLTQNVNAYTSLAHAARERVEHIHVDVDVKGVPKHLVNATVSAVQNKQSKTALKQSYSGSAAGGSYTSGPHNDGGGQSH